MLSPAGSVLLKIACELLSVETLYVLVPLLFLIAFTTTFLVPSDDVCDVKDDADVVVTAADTNGISGFGVGSSVGLGTEVTVGTGVVVGPVITTGAGGCTCILCTSVCLT